MNATILALREDASEFDTTDIQAPRGEPLRESVRGAVDGYLRNLDGHRLNDLYELVLAEVEKPMLETVMQHVGGNQTHAARVLGVSRGTLRKKLQKYAVE